MHLDAIADRLYSLPPDQFTAAREAAAREATDAAAAKAIRALRKPTAAAHAVNRLARDRACDLDDLLDLGTQLRAAMSGDPAAVRALADRRRALVAALVDKGLPSGVQLEIAATLEAATADPDAAAAVRAGRLVKPLQYAGFGPALGAVTTPRAAASRPAGPDLAAMREKVLELSGAADDAQRRYELAAAAVEQARAVLVAAEARRDEARAAAEAAHELAERARAELGAAERS